jgi:SPASM domain peptide maturase of grasp-with-spasm system
MQRKEKYFKLFANCIPVKGANTSIIMDLQRRTYIEIPNLLYNILLKNSENFSISKLKNAFGNQYNEGIKAYFNFFVKNELGFYTNTPNLFPHLTFKFLSPYKIITAVIGINIASEYNITNVFMQLKDLGCQYLQIQIMDDIDYKSFFEKLTIFEDSRLRILDIFFVNSNPLQTFLNKYNGNDKRIFIYVMNCSKNCIKKIPYSPISIFYMQSALKPYPKEIISQNTFTTNILFYLEALHYNVGLHRKVSIDYNGDIKNYINHNKTYGNVKQDNLCYIIEQYEFQEKWHINNDKIEICKDCQYRYMCLSNSDIISQNERYYKKTQCDFNPYTNIWKNNNRPSQKK